MTSEDIRKQFLDFFHSKRHHIIPSAPIVVKNDPSLMFTNAGMNQFKDIFLGNKEAPYPRIADTQKCLRVSGKHNDLEEVGVDTYHHTMFEMLGNWSFGDYFKKEAIAWSWELLTEVYKMDKSRLYITVFEGDEKENLPKDEEALGEWKNYIDSDRILMGNKKDNFWEMGDNGPCGPCTEIHVDCRTNEERKQIDGKMLVNNDHPQVIEIWNNVFIQYNRKKDGSLEPLPARHVDTGMGFERLVRVLQNKQSNYDTDIFTGTISEVEKITGKEYIAHEINSSATTARWREAVSFRVIADHIRAICFSIADGQLPSNTGAGYVIRRILRRAVRYYFTYLNHKKPLLFQLVPVLARQFENVFPELIKQVDFITKVVKEEEEGFLRTLDNGLKRIATIIDTILKDETKERFIKGEDAFELLDTYGFPLDLINLIAAENDLSVDIQGFEKEMQKQKQRSRAVSAVETGDWIEVTQSDLTFFVGYSELTIETRVAKYRRVESKKKEQFQIVLEKTPFYAESGGQVGDTGSLKFGDEAILVSDTKRENELIIHYTDQLPADISLPVLATVNQQRRLHIMYNHTATHLLHATLRQVIGNHVSQKGSFVSPDLLRFDFSHFARITDEELRNIEFIVNEKIRTNLPVIIRELPKEEALKTGAMALFGEKYGDIVRIVTMDPDWSVEFCGGTHVEYTGMVGLFAITSESSIASGVRRIEAVTGAKAIAYFEDIRNQFKQTSELLKSKDPLKAIEKLQNDKTQLEKKIEKMESRQGVDIRNELIKKAEDINGLSFIADIIEVDSPAALKKICFDLKNYLTDYVAVLGAYIDNKPFIAIGISESIVNEKNLDAGKIIKEKVSDIIKGGGGGQKTLATAGGQEGESLDKVIEMVRKLL